LNDERMIERIRKGDEAAINEIIEKYSKLLWHIASAVLKNASVQDVEECVADVFIFLWRQPEKFDPQRGNLKTWLSTVTRSRAIDRYRSIMRRNEIALMENVPIEQMGLAETVMDRETKCVLISAVKALKEPEREIIIRRFFYEQKPKEIALVLDMPVKSVENCLYRTKLKLREAISR